jgi:hypothetical protein
VRCPTDGLQLALLSLGDGNDVQSVPNLDRVQRPCALPLVVDAGEGNDVVVTCRDADTVAQLGGGNDTLYVGTAASVEADLGAGDDRVATFNGATFGPGTYDGGPGNDLLLGTPAKETFIGGEGVDRVEFPHNRVDANLDGQPNDSPEGDHVHGGVEELAASVPGSVLTGSDGPDTLLSGGAGVTLRGAGGDDTLLGSDYGETLEGGPGRDRITAGFGDDLIDPGPGTDTVDADRQADDGFAAGNDTVHARDGEADQIGCNIGADVAVLDPSDAADACEQMDRGAPAPGPGASPSLTLKVTRASRRSGLRVRLSTPTAVKVKVVARHKGRVVARGTVKTKAGRPVSATLRFKPKPPRKASLKITATAPGFPSRTVKTTVKGS